MLASASWPVTNYTYRLNKWLNKAQPDQSQWPREIQHRSPCWIGPVRSLCERVSICVAMALRSGLAGLHIDTQAGLLADHCGSWPQADSMSRRAHTHTHTDREAVTEALLFRHSHSFRLCLAFFVLSLWTLTLRVTTDKCQLLNGTVIHFGVLGEMSTRCLFGLSFPTPVFSPLLLSLTLSQTSLLGRGNTSSSRDIQATWTDRKSSTLDCCHF